MDQGLTSAVFVVVFQCSSSLQVGMFKFMSGILESGEQGRVQLLQWLGGCIQANMGTCLISF